MVILQAGLLTTRPTFKTASRSVMFVAHISQILTLHYRDAVRYYVRSLQKDVLHEMVQISEDLAAVWQRQARSAERSALPLSYPAPYCIEENVNKANGLSQPENTPHEDKAVSIICITFTDIHPAQHCLCIH